MKYIKTIKYMEKIFERNTDEKKHVYSNNTQQYSG